MIVKNLRLFKLGPCAYLVIEKSNQLKYHLTSMIKLLKSIFFYSDTSQIIRLNVVHFSSYFFFYSKLTRFQKIFSRQTCNLVARGYRRQVYARAALCRSPIRPYGRRDVRIVSDRFARAARRKILLFTSTALFVYVRIYGGPTTRWSA